MTPTQTQNHGGEERLAVFDRLPEGDVPRAAHEEALIATEPEGVEVVDWMPMRFVKPMPGTEARTLMDKALNDLGRSLPLETISGSRKVTDEIPDQLLAHIYEEVAMSLLPEYSLADCIAKGRWIVERGLALLADPAAAAALEAKSEQRLTKEGCTDVIAMASFNLSHRLLWRGLCDEALSTIQLSQATQATKRGLVDCFLTEASLHYIARRQDKAGLALRHAYILDPAGFEASRKRLAHELVGIMSNEFNRD